MRLEDIVTRPETIRIIKDAAINSIADVLFSLELYKFMDRPTIISRLVEQTKEVIEDVEPFESVEEFKQLETRMGVRIKKVDTYSVKVYYPAFSQIQKEPIELALAKYGVEFVKLTPYNFKVVKDPSMSWVKYDRDILFKRILLEVIDRHATDLHFCVEHPELGKTTYPIKYRANGLMYSLDMFELTESLNREIISGLIENKTSANSLDLVTASGVTAMANDPLGDGNIELRVAANKAIDGCQCVIRIQKKETFNFTIDSLGFDAKTCQALYKMTKKRAGIVFITGAIRTGKNTTAFALANEMVKEPLKIVSYEYPVEVLMPFTQIDYGGDVDVLLNAVRLAKKQDVNVAFINELPNREVAFAVQDLVNSSVYVITTMHVNRIWHLPYKLKEYYGDEYKNVISQIDGVFNQKMFMIPCKKCQKTMLVDSVEDESHRKILSEQGIKNVSVSTGCEYCNGTGYQSGINQPYVEYLEFTEELKSKLLACEYPYEMEAILKDLVFKNGVALECSISDAIRQGNLGLDALNSID